MTECPICHSIEINKDTRLCPMCGIDLEIYKLIEKEETNHNKTRRWSKLSYTISILLFLLLIGSITMLFMRKNLILPYLNSENNPEMKLILKENDRYKNEIKQLNNKIEELNKTARQADQQNQIPSDLPVMTASLKSDPVKNTSSTPQNNSSSIDKTNFKIHVVKEGETAYGIARMYYGDGSKFNKLIKDNNLKDATFITAGAELKIYDTEK